MNDIAISLAITNLKDYNQGVLAFKWLDLPTTESEIDGIYNKISNDYEDEVFVSDIDQVFEYIKNSGEYMTYNDVIRLNDFLNDFDGDSDMLKALIEYQGDDLLELLNSKYIDFEDIRFYDWITTNEEYAKFYLEEYEFDLNNIEVYIDFDKLGEDFAKDLGYSEEDDINYYEFGKDYLEDVGCENILNFSDYIDLDMMGNDFAMDGYISDYGYIELP